MLSPFQISNKAQVLFYKVTKCFFFILIWNHCSTILSGQFPDLIIIIVIHRFLKVSDIWKMKFDIWKTLALNWKVYACVHNTKYCIARYSIILEKNLLYNKKYLFCELLVFWASIIEKIKHRGLGIIIVPNIRIACF